MQAHSQHSLAGKVAFVTGAAQGLGLGIARAFAEAGAIVVLADIRADIAEIAAGLDATGERAAGMMLDVRDEAAFQAQVDGVITRFGKLDILVNNAATTISKPVWDIPAAEWDDVMAVNLRSVFFGCRIAGKQMRVRKEAGESSTFPRLPASAAAWWPGRIIPLPRPASSC